MKNKSGVRGQNIPCPYPVLSPRSYLIKCVPHPFCESALSAAKINHLRRIRKLNSFSRKLPDTSETNLLMKTHLFIINSQANGPSAPLAQKALPPPLPAPPQSVHTSQDTCATEGKPADHKDYSPQYQSHAYQLAAGPA